MLEMAANIRLQNSEELPKLLTVRQLAAYLGRPESTVYYWRSRGLGPRGFKAGKRTMFKIADVAAWLEEQRGADV
jgi:predicted DNA-binding transcriptional regulator AlpA